MIGRQEAFVTGVVAGSPSSANTKMELPGLPILLLPFSLLVLSIMRS